MEDKLREKISWNVEEKIGGEIEGEGDRLIKCEKFEENQEKKLVGTWRRK